MVLAMGRFGPLQFAFLISLMPNGPRNLTLPDAGSSTPPWTRKTPRERIMLPCLTNLAGSTLGSTMRQLQTYKLAVSYARPPFAAMALEYLPS